MATIGFNKARLVSLLVIVFALMVLGGAAGGGIVLAQMGDDEAGGAEESAAPASGSGGVALSSHGGGLGKYFLPASGDEVANILAPGLDRAVADDAIERSEADALLGWVRSAPAAVFTLPDRLETAIKADGDLFFGELVEDKEPFDVQAAIASELGVTGEELEKAWRNAFVGSILVPFAFALTDDGDDAASQLSDEERIEQLFNDQLATVAEELGVTTEAVELAFENATRAAEQAFIDGYLDGLVAANVFSRSEADQVRSWVNSYHDVVPADALGFGGIFGGFGGFGGFGFGLLSGGFGGLGGIGLGIGSLLGGDVLTEESDDWYEFEFGDDFKSHGLGDSDGVQSFEERNFNLDGEDDTEQGEDEGEEEPAPSGAGGV